MQYCLGCESGADNDGSHWHPPIPSNLLGVELEEWLSKQMPQSKRVCELKQIQEFTRTKMPSSRLTLRRKGAGFIYRLGIPHHLRLYSGDNGTIPLRFQVCGTDRFSPLHPQFGRVKE